MKQLSTTLKRLKLKVIKNDEAISKKLENFELIQSTTKKLVKLPTELENKIEKIPKHIDNSYSKVLQRNIEENKEEKIIKCG